MGLEKDLPPGDQLIALFRPFLEHLAASDLSPKTVQKHVDNVWVLGGESGIRAWLTAGAPPRQEWEARKRNDL